MFKTLWTLIISRGACPIYIHHKFSNMVFLLGRNYNRILTIKTGRTKQRTLLSCRLFFFFFWEDVIVWSSLIEDNRGHWTSDVKIIPSAFLGVTFVLFCKHQSLTWKHFLAKKGVFTTLPSYFICQEQVRHQFFIVSLMLIYINNTTQVQYEILKSQILNPNSENKRNLELLFTWVRTFKYLN